LERLTVSLSSLQVSIGVFTMFQAFEVKSAKGVKCGKISVVTTEKGTVCVVEWIGQAFMFFAGPAMILFKSGRNELIVEFTGTTCVIGPCCKLVKGATIDDSAAYFTILHNIGYRAMGDVFYDQYVTYLQGINKDGMPVLNNFCLNNTITTTWDRINYAEPAFSCVESQRVWRY
jgi:hypothetical protein